MSARLIFCTILAIGSLLMAGASVGFAQTGLDDSGNAGTQQYGKSTPPAQSDVLGEVGTVEEEEAPAPAPEPVQNTAPQQTPAQAPQQVAAAQDNDSLPFTGFTAIPVLLLGVALLSSGVFLRRKTSREDLG